MTWSKAAIVRLGCELVVDVKPTLRILAANAQPIGRGAAMYVGPLLPDVQWRQFTLLNRGDGIVTVSSYGKDVVVGLVLVPVEQPIADIFTGQEGTHHYLCLKVSYRLIGHRPSLLKRLSQQHSETVVSDCQKPVAVSGPDQAVE
jgi:hypothetical protein